MKRAFFVQTSTYSLSFNTMLGPLGINAVYFSIFISFSMLFIFATLCLGNYLENFLHFYILLSSASPLLSMSLFSSFSCSFFISDSICFSLLLFVSLCFSLFLSVSLCFYLFLSVFLFLSVSLSLSVSLTVSVFKQQEVLTWAPPDFIQLILLTIYCN